MLQFRSKVLKALGNSKITGCYICTTEHTAQQGCLTGLMVEGDQGLSQIEHVVGAVVIAFLYLGQLFERSQQIVSKDAAQKYRILVFANGADFINHAAKYIKYAG